MTTIAASQIVNVLPSVLSAGGNELVLNGMVLTNRREVPINAPFGFTTPTAVANFFGATSVEAQIAAIYFKGYLNALQRPKQILFAQYPAAAVGAYVRGGNVSGLSIPTLASLQGAFSVVIDGNTYSASSLSLAGATSFTAAAALIQAGLNATLPAASSFTGSIAPASTTLTGSIAGNVLTVSAIVSGSIVPGAQLSGTGIAAGTAITSQMSGLTGGVGTYAVSVAQVVPSTSGLTAASGLLTVSAMSSGTLSVGQTVTGTGIAAGTIITGLGTGIGLVGTYVLGKSQTVASEAMTSTGTPLTVGYNSQLGQFYIQSGAPGSQSTSAYATGSLATSLLMTSATGAVLSPGSAAQAPSTTMNAIVGVTQNWATFMLAQDPDMGSGSAVKQLFAAWVSQTNDRYLYAAGDTDTSPCVAFPAPASFGYIATVINGFDGTMPLYDPTFFTLPAFVCGMVASINYGATNGTITMAFKGQDGIVATVTDSTTANNLDENGYSFYGAYATANQNFRFLYPGSVSGQWEWADDFVNQIWLNNEIQLALMELATNTPKIPYDNYGYELIVAACLDPINAGLNNGMIQTGVSLSTEQAAEANLLAGVKVDTVLQSQGWYLQVKDPGAAARGARTTPACLLLYTSGEAVQQITLNSVEVQ